MAMPSFEQVQSLLLGADVKPRDWECPQCGGNDGFFTLPGIVSQHVYVLHLHCDECCDPCVGTCPGRDYIWNVTSDRAELLRLAGEVW